MQSPVRHAAPFPLTPFKLLGPVPLALKLQFVRGHTRPAQSQLTSTVEQLPATSSKPPVDGPTPFWVPMPGHMVSWQLLQIVMGTLLPLVLFVCAVAV